MKNYDLFDKVRFCLGDEILLDNILKAIKCDELNDIIEYIARCYDIPREGEDEDE